MSSDVQGIVGCEGGQGRPSGSTYIMSLIKMPLTKMSLIKMPVRNVTDKDTAFME